jgi:hypothetical protein
MKHKKHGASFAEVGIKKTRKLKEIAKRAAALAADTGNPMYGSKAYTSRTARARALIDAQNAEEAQAPRIVRKRRYHSPSREDFYRTESETATTPEEAAVYKLPDTPEGMLQCIRDWGSNGETKLTERAKEWLLNAQVSVGSLPESISRQHDTAKTIARIVEYAFRLGLEIEGSRTEAWKHAMQRGARQDRAKLPQKAKAAQAATNAPMRRARMLAALEWYLWHGNPDGRTPSKRWKPARKWYAACRWAAGVERLDAKGEHLPACSVPALKSWFNAERVEPQAVARITFAAHWDATREALKLAKLYTGKDWAPGATPEAVLAALADVKPPAIYR